MAKQVRFVKQPLVEGQAVAEVAAFDADGNPVDVTGGSGSAVPAEGSITNAMLAGGITKDKLAAGVIPVVPAAPTADTLSGATDTGKSVMKAKDAAAARTAIGAGAPYSLPAATATVLGGVKQAAYVADPAGDTVTKAESIALRNALVTAGSMAPKA